MKSKKKNMKIKDIQLEDFQENTLIFMVAKKDLRLAIEILRKYGGKKLYFPKWKSIRRSARDREIVKRAWDWESFATIGQDFGISEKRTRNIYLKGIEDHLGRS